MVGASFMQLVQDLCRARKAGFLQGGILLDSLPQGDSAGVNIASSTEPDKIFDTKVKKTDHDNKEFPEVATGMKCMSSEAVRRELGQPGKCPESCKVSFCTVTKFLESGRSATVSVSCAAASSWVVMCSTNNRQQPHESRQYDIILSRSFQATTQSFGLWDRPKATVNQFECWQAILSWDMRELDFCEDTFPCIHQLHLQISRARIWLFCVRPALSNLGTCSKYPCPLCVDLKLCLKVQIS